MKAAIYTKYGPPEVLKIEEVEPPVLRAEDDGRLLINVYSASVNPFDVLHRKGYLPTRIENGLRTPKRTILGIDMAGTVAAVSGNVTQFQVGERVYGICMGTHAEYARARQTAIARMPEGLTFNEAAAIPTAALTALQALRDLANVQPGQKVAIIGASGGIGHFAVQLARVLGAEITAVTSSANLGWVSGLGAQHVIDYTKEDFTRSGERYDLIYDAAAARTYRSCRAALTPNGVYISEHPLKPSGQLFQWLLSMITKDKRFKTHLSQPNQPDLVYLNGLVEAGKLKPVIETCYPLAQIAAAHRHVEGGHTKGKVVVSVVER